MQFKPNASSLIAIAAAIAVIGCGQEPPPPPTPAPSTVAPPPKPEITVKIGHVAPMTGGQAHLGADNRNGAMLAIDEINASRPEIGGAIVTFQLLAEDDQADPKQGTVVAQKLVDEKVAGIIGHLNSGTTVPASKIYFDAGIPQISGSATTPAYTAQGFATAFRVMANDIQQGKALGEFAAKQGFKTVALIDDRTAYGQGITDEFKKAADVAGIKVVASEFTTDKATDFKAVLTKIKSKKPDLVFFGGMDSQGGPMAKQMKELGIKATLLGGDGICTPEFAKLAGAAAEGQFCSLPGMPLDKLAKGPVFLSKFTKKFGAGVQLYAPYVYDAVMVMVDSMKRADSVDPSKYLAEIGKTKFKGVTSTIEFDEKGDLKNSAISFYRFQAGALDYVETIGGAPVSSPPPAVEASTAPAAPPVAPASK
jgi:branched-chain amino acid transport system substrate-binding protein